MGILLLADAPFSLTPFHLENTGPNTDQCTRVGVCMHEPKCTATRRVQSSSRPPQQRLCHEAQFIPYPASHDFWLGARHLRSPAWGFSGQRPRSTLASPHPMQHVQTTAAAAEYDKADGSARRSPMEDTDNRCLYYSNPIHSSSETASSCCRMSARVSPPAGIRRLVAPSDPPAMDS